MTFRGFFIFLFLLGPCALYAQAGDLAPVREFVHNFVERYQNDIRERMGHRLRVELSERDEFFASVDTDREGKFYLEIRQRVLRELTREQLSFVLCHEVGHLLGHVTFADLPSEKNRHKIDTRASIEGESDYFAGICLRNRMDFDTAVTAARDVFIRLKGGPIDPEKAVSQKADGIDPKWPQKECRLLSVIRGYEGGLRPACWYNP